MYFYIEPTLSFVQWECLEAIEIARGGHVKETAWNLEM